MINGILHRVRTGVQWRDLPERFGPWKTVYERHGCGRPTERGNVCCSRSRPRPMPRVRSTGTSRWTQPSSVHISTRPGPAPTCRRPRHQRGRQSPNTRTKSHGRAFNARLVEMVRQVRAWAARGAGSPASSTTSTTTARPSRGRRPAAARPGAVRARPSAVRLPGPGQRGCAGSGRRPGLPLSRPIATPPRSTHCPFVAYLGEPLRGREFRETERFSVGTRGSVVVLHGSGSASSTPTRDHAAS